MRASLVIDIDCCAGPADAVAEQCFLALNSHYKRISISKPLAGWLSVLAESQIHRQPQIWVLVQDPPIAMPSNESVLTVSQLYTLHIGASRSRLQVVNTTAYEHIHLQRRQAVDGNLAALGRCFDFSHIDLGTNQLRV